MDAFCGSVRVLTQHATHGQLPGLQIVWTKSGHLDDDEVYCRLCDSEGFGVQNRTTDLPAPQENSSCGLQSHWNEQLMPFYFYYAQTPELQQLPTQAERDAVHAEAWRRLRRDRPQLWLRSFLMIMLFAFVGVSTFEIWGAAIGSLAGALLHTHSMACELRPVYSNIIERSKVDA